MKSNKKNPGNDFPKLAKAMDIYKMHTKGLVCILKERPINELILGYLFTLSIFYHFKA